MITKTEIIKESYLRFSTW